MVATGLLFVWPAPVVVITHGTVVASFVIANLLNGSITASQTTISNLFFLVSTASLFIYSFGRFPCPHEQSASTFTINIPQGVGGTCLNPHYQRLILVTTRFVGK